jgi:hypothetical protein
MAKSGPRGWARSWRRRNGVDRVGARRAPGPRGRGRRHRGRRGCGRDVGFARRARPSAASARAAGIAALNKASTSSRGVTKTTINVVFPISNLTTLASNFGFAGDVEFGAEEGHQHVRERRQRPRGHQRPQDQPDHRQLRSHQRIGDAGRLPAVDQGNPAVFAVVDGLGSWTGDNELCITQEGHTPFIGQWTTTTNWTTRAPRTCGGRAPTRPRS